jgi:hypothetical protein
MEAAHGPCAEPLRSKVPISGPCPQPLS